MNTPVDAPDDNVGSVAEYLAVLGARSIPVHPDTVAAPLVSFPVPLGWSEVSREVLPGAYRAWARQSEGDSTWSDNAVVLVSRLDQWVDPGALLQHAFTDSRRMPGWQEIQTDTGDCGGFPSAAITGEYSVHEMDLLAHTRYVLIDEGPVSYLLQATITVQSVPSALSDVTRMSGGLSIRLSAADDGQSGDADSRASQPAGAPVETRNIATADVRGIVIGLDSSGLLDTLTIDSDAFTKGPEALAMNIMAAYREAAASLPQHTSQSDSGNPPDPSRWRAPAADGY